MPTEPKVSLTPESPVPSSPSPDAGKTNGGKKPDLAHLVSFSICTFHSYPPPTIHSQTNQKKTGASTKQFHVEHRKKLESRKYKDEPEIVDYEEVVSTSQTHQNRKVKCECYSGTMFARLRAHWHVQENQYLASMANLHGGQEGEGKSKMLFFKSKDERYVIKTVKEYVVFF